MNENTRDSAYPVIEYNMGRMPDDDLHAIIRYLADRGPRLGPRGAEFLLATFFVPEGLRRELGGDTEPRRYFQLPLDLPNAILADVLIVLHSLSFAEGLTESSARFVDQLASQAAALASIRLRFIPDELRPQSPLGLN